MSAGKEGEKVKMSALPLGLMIAVVGLCQTGVSQSVSAGACAHRGDKSVCPENTVPAFQSAVKKGAHMIEMDVALTRDGVPVILHDPTLDRTTDGQGPVSELTLEEIKTLDAGSWKSQEWKGTQVPTFQEALAAIPTGPILNVHLKGEADLVPKVCDLIVAAGKKDQCILACSEAQGQKAREICPGLKICYLEKSGNTGTDYPDRAMAFGADFVQIWGWHDSTPERVKALHERGIRVNYFGTSDPVMMRKLIDAGIDYILTDDLDVMMQVLGEN